MGCMMRKYTGTDPIAGLVVADGVTAGTCVVCTDETTEPLGVAVSVDPNGNVDIAGPGDRAFVYAGSAIAADASSAVCCDSAGKIIPRSPSTAETSAWQLGTLIRVDGSAIVKDELAEIMINPVYMAVASTQAEESTQAEGGAQVETPTPEESGVGTGG